MIYISIKYSYNENFNILVHMELCKIFVVDYVFTLFWIIKKLFRIYFIIDGLVSAGMG